MKAMWSKAIIGNPNDRFVTRHTLETPIGIFQVYWVMNCTDVDYVISFNDNVIGVASTLEYGKEVAEKHLLRLIEELKTFVGIVPEENVMDND